VREQITKKREDKEKMFILQTIEGMPIFMHVPVERAFPHLKSITVFLNGFYWQ